MKRKHMSLKSQSRLLAITQINGMLEFQSFLKNNHMGSKLGFHGFLELSWRHAVI
jgi:hypothetical protein